MNYLTVDLFRDFYCLADACPNTCCARWDIQMDKKTYEKMVEKEDELGTPAKDWLEEEKDIFYVKMNDRRCPMLNEKNLCNVVIHLGPEYLCEVCKVYPRVLNGYGGTVEGHLTMSCPDVIYKLMEKDEVEFDFVEDDTVVPDYLYTELYEFESVVRSNMVEILQDMPDISLNTRLFAAFTILEEGIRMYENRHLDRQLFQLNVTAYVQKPVLEAMDRQILHAVDEKRRFQLLKQILTIAGDYKDHEHFYDLIQRAIEYFDYGYTENYVLGMERFKDEILRNYGNFYTNYWVYRIFSGTLFIPEYEKSKEKFIYIALEFALFQTIALACFARGEFNKKEYVYIISCLSRMMEHNLPFYKRVTSEIVKNNLVSVAGLLMLTIV